MMDISYRVIITAVLGTVVPAALPLPESSAAAGDVQPEPAAAGPQDSEPWDLDGPPRSFSETCFSGRNSDSEGLAKAEAERWLEPVEGQPFELIESAQNKHGRAVTLKGFARLRAPWKPDTVLRLSTYSTKPFRVHLWHPQQGVTMYYFPYNHWHCWVA